MGNKIIRIVLIIVVLSTITFGLFVGNHFYQRSWVTVMALECLWEKQGSVQEYNEWYLIKKRPSDELPQGFFRGTHRLSKLTDEEIYQEYDRLWFYDENSYTFGDYDTYVKNPYYEPGTRANSNPTIRQSPTKYHTLNRKNLNMTYSKLATFTYASCKEITENEFYRNIRIQIKKKNSEYKL